MQKSDWRIKTLGVKYPLPDGTLVKVDRLHKVPGQVVGVVTFPGVSKQFKIGDEIIMLLDKEKALKHAS